MKQKKKIAIKKMLVIGALMLFVMSLSACGNKQAADDFMDKVALLEEKKLPTLKEVKELEE